MAPSPDASTPGELVVEPPTLINLGFEWFIEGDANRNAAVDVSFRKAGDAAWQPGAAAAAAAAASASTPSRAWTSSRRTCSRAACSTSSRTPPYEVRLTLADPDGVHGRDRRGRDRAHAARAEAVCRRPRVSRLPARLQGHEDRAVVRRADVRLQLLVRGHRLGDVGPAARAAGRHDPRARRRLQVQPLRVHQQRRGESHRAARRHLLPDRRRHGGDADRHQGRRRRRGRLRRRRQLRAVRRARRRLHLLRGPHVPERRDRHPGRHAVHRRREGADGQAQPLRERRRRRLHQLLRLEQLLHRRQHVHRPQRSRST